MDRRAFLKLSAVSAGAAATLPPLGEIYSGNAAEVRKKLDHLGAVLAFKTRLVATNKVRWERFVTDKDDWKLEFVPRLALRYDKQVRITASEDLWIEQCVIEDVDRNKLADIDDLRRYSLAPIDTFTVNQFALFLIKS